MANSHVSNLFSEIPQPTRLIRDSAVRPIRSGGGNHCVPVAPDFAACGASLAAVCPITALSCIQHSALFRGVPPVQSAHLASLALGHQYHRQEILFHEDDPVRWVSVIGSGRVKVTQLSRAGKEVILRVDGSGEVIEGFGAGLASLHRVSAQAIEPAHVFSWEAQTFAALADGIPAIQRNLTNILTERLRSLEERFREMATERVPQRLARILLTFFEQNTPASPSVPIALSCEELAQMAGTTLFTVSRLLCQWAAQGIIEPERKRVLIENLPALMEIAGD